MTHEPHITPSRHDLDRMNTDAALARALELLAEREREVERLKTRVEWFEKSGGVTAHTLVHQQRTQLTKCRRLLREICDAIDAAPEWPSPVLSRLGVEWHKDAIIQAARAAGAEHE